MSFGIASVAAITVICYLVGIYGKTAEYISDENIPVIVGVVGGILGIVAFFIGMPDFPATDIITAIAVGIVSGLAAVGINQLKKQIGYKNDMIDNLSNNGGDDNE